MVSSGQSEQQYGPVVDHSVTLAGNVGEIRANHFHSGIDIKAPRGIGSQILAAADGYVSRIGVSPTGYGNVLYITHPDGHTTVYGHLNGFRKSIADWVYEQQMAKKSFRVDLYPTKSQFPVTKGQTIGYMGNSGSSGGPHLHFEIRDAHGSPVNLVQRGIINPTDKISPNIYSIMLYESDEVMGVAQYSLRSQITIKKNRDGLWQMSDTVIRASRPFYLAYEVIDFKNGSSNTMGIYSLRQSVDSVEQFSFAIDRISFATTRYINSFVQFDRNHATKNHVVRAYVSANNALSVYRNVKNRGIIAPPALGEQLQIETTVGDDAGNTSTVAFTVVADGSPRAAAQPLPSMHKVAWDDDVTITDSALVVGFPSRSLYDSAVLPFSVDSAGVIEVGNDATPLQKAIKVRVKRQVEAPLRTKALFCNVKNKSVVSATYDDGWLLADLRSMGRYRVVYDTTAPKITFNGLKNGELTWRVTDDLAAVGRYELIVDGKWALAEWDPKSSTMSHRIRTLQSEPKSHTVTLKVSDYKQNTVTSKSNPKW